MAVKTVNKATLPLRSDAVPATVFAASGMTLLVNKNE